MGEIIRFPRRWHPKSDLSNEIVQLFVDSARRPKPPRPNVRPRSNNTFFICPNCGGDHLQHECRGMIL